MKKIQTVVIAFLSTLVIVILGLIVWVYSVKWTQPLGPALQILQSKFQIPLISTLNPSGSPLATLQPATLNQASATAQTGQCAMPSVSTMLAIGSDTRADKYTYGLADVIRLIRIDSITPKITVLEFPRDLWVQIPDIADNLKGQDHEKLNQAYLYGNPGFGYTDDPAQGPGLLTRTLALNFGTQVDHYAAVNMHTFVRVVDAVGGIDVNLPATVDGRTADDPNARLLFLKGENHLNGTRALTLARTRIDGVFQRADHQNLVLCALRKKLTSPKVIENIPDIISSFQGAIQTDLSLQQLSQLACLGTKLQPENIIFTSFPENLFAQDRIYDPVFKKEVFYWNTDFAKLRDYVSQFNNGTWPLATAAVKTNNQQGDSLNCQ